MELIRKSNDTKRMFVFNRKDNDNNDDVKEMNSSTM